MEDYTKAAIIIAIAATIEPRKRIVNLDEVLAREIKQSPKGSVLRRSFRIDPAYGTIPELSNTLKELTFDYKVFRLWESGDDKEYEVMPGLLELAEEVIEKSDINEEEMDYLMMDIVPKIRRYLR